MITLVPMTEEAFAVYLATATGAYAQDNVLAGRWPEEGALARAVSDFAESLPEGLATPDNFLYEIVDDATGAAVGILWFAVQNKNGLAGAFVYDLEVRPEYRRRGFATAAFRELETVVRALGIDRIGLHVFGQNDAAQSMYRRLGYGVTGVNMLKKLDSV